MKASYNRVARKEAFDRSNGVCQFCGLAPASEAHHHAYPKYPREKDLSADDLVALCKPCHQTATYIRRVHTHHGPAAVHDFHVSLETLVERLFGQ